MGKIVFVFTDSLGLTPNQGWFVFQIGAAALLVANYGLQPGTAVGIEWIVGFTFLAVIGGLVLILEAVAQVQAYLCRGVGRGGETPVTTSNDAFYCPIEGARLTDSRDKSRSSRCWFSFRSKMISRAPYVDA